MIVVTSESPFSYRKVASDIARVLEALDVPVTYLSEWNIVKPVVGDCLILVGSLSTVNHPALKYFRRVIIYFDMPTVPAFTHLVRRYVLGLKHKAYFIANSRFMADLFERYIGLSVDYVIHHGSDIGYVPIRYRTGDVITVAFYSGRKWIDGVRIVAERLTTIMFTLVTNRYMPNMPTNVRLLLQCGRLDRRDYVKLLASHVVYLCTSLHEGFCLPVLESACVGLVPVVPNIPPYIEYVPDWARRYDSHIDPDRTVQVSKYEVIPYVEHNVDDMVSKVLDAFETKPSVTDVVNYADRWNIFNIYRTFIEFIR